MNLPVYSMLRLNAYDDISEPPTCALKGASCDLAGPVGPKGLIAETVQSGG
jgi:hypothetical protein